MCMSGVVATVGLVSKSQDGVHNPMTRTLILFHVHWKHGE